MFTEDYLLNYPIKHVYDDFVSIELLNEKGMIYEINLDNGHGFDTLCRRAEKLSDCKTYNHSDYK